MTLDIKSSRALSQGITFRQDAKNPYNFNYEIDEDFNLGKIVAVTEENLTYHPQVICFINPKHPTYNHKIRWLHERFKEGLTIKLLYPPDGKKAIGFIEYVPGEYAWRAVSVKDYMFIHCIWVYSNAYKNQGIGSRLLDDCFLDAKTLGKKGVAVLSGSVPFLAQPPVFLKNGFEVVETAKPAYQLLVRQINPAPPPHFNDWQKALKSYQGLNIVYSRKCPWVARFVAELDEFLKKSGLQINIHELKTPTEAQIAPSPYASFNLIYNGKLLADRYISMTRFRNILRKEKLIG